VNLVACSGDWLAGSNGEPICQGMLQIVTDGNLSGFPEITYAQANILLGSVVLLFATVWGLRQLRRVF